MQGSDMLQPGIFKSIAMEDIFEKKLAFETGRTVRRQ